jgi:hypothetical protein
MNIKMKSIKNYNTSSETIYNVVHRKPSYNLTADRIVPHIQGLETDPPLAHNMNKNKNEVQLLIIFF